MKSKLAKQQKGNSSRKAGKASAKSKMRRYATKPKPVGINAAAIVRQKLLKKGSSETSGRSDVRSWVTSNPTGSITEVVFEYTDFFDSTGDKTKAVNEYIISLRDVMGMPGPASDSLDTVTKVEKVELFALPRFSLDSATSSVMIITGVKVRPATEANTSGKYYAAQQSTLITPASTPDWVRVGYWDAKKTLGEANLMLTCLDETDAIPIMRSEVLEPDTFTPSATKVQYMLKYTVAAPIPQVTAVQAYVANLGNWDSAMVSVPLERTQVMAKALRVQNKV